MRWRALLIALTVVVLNCQAALGREKWVVYGGGDDPDPKPQLISPRAATARVTSGITLGVRLWAQWGHPVSCQPTWWWAVLRADWLASTNTSTCHVTFNSLYRQTLTWPEVCAIAVHEVGHIALGLNYFQASSPAEPWHSPDLSSIMHTPNLVVPRECDASGRMREPQP